MPLNRIGSVFCLFVIAALSWTVSRSASAEEPAGRVSQTAKAEAKLVVELPGMRVPNVPLSDVLEFIKDISGIPMDVDWKVMDKAGVKRDQQIDALVKNVKIEEALRIILLVAGGPGNLDYVLEGGRLKVSTAEALALKTVDDRAALERDLARKRKQVLSIPFEPPPDPVEALRDRPPRDGPRRLAAVKLDDKPFADCIDFVRDICEINIIVRWPALEAAGVKPDTKLTARLPADASLSQWFDPLLAAVKTKEKQKLTYTFADGVVIISTKDEIDKIESQPPFKHVR